MREKEKQKKAYKNMTKQDAKKNIFKFQHCHLRYSNPKYIMKMKKTIITGILFPKHENSAGERVCKACLASKMKELFPKKIDIKISKQI